MARLLRILIVVLIAIGVAIPAVLIFRQQPAAAATMVLSILDGTAEVARGSGTFTRVGDGHVLDPGDRVRTPDQSHAVVTFFDGSTVEIEPGTTVTLLQASATPAGSVTIQLEQDVGRTWSSLLRFVHPDSRFELKTPVASATVRGTGFLTDVLSSGMTTVTTSDGIVEVSAQGQTVVVPAGSSTTVQPATAPSPPAPAARPQNRLRFGLHSAARLVVVDPFGRACGAVPASPTVVRQIPGCLATDIGIEPQLVDLPDPVPGAYAIVIESIAPGGDFVATASGLDSAGAVTFNYIVSGGGPAGTRFGSSITVESTSGALRAAGLAKLTLLDRTPARVVVMPASSGSPRPTAHGTPNASLFPPLPRFGYTAGADITPPPSGATAPPSATSSASPTPTASASPTQVAAPEPTPTRTVAPVRTAPPPPPPTPEPTPVPTVTPQPTPVPTPTPSPTPSGPMLSGGPASPGSGLNVIGHGWSTALITISWEDGRPLVQVNADAAGDFAVGITVPFDAAAGTTYRLTASDGRFTATSLVTVYAPRIAVSCSTVGAPVSISGAGWPPLGRYALRSSLLATPLSGVVGADGAFVASFTPPFGTLPGEYVITANVGSLLAEAQTCTLR